MTVRNPKIEDIKLAEKYANYILNTFSTINATAISFGTDRKFVEYRIYKILPIVNPKLYERVKKVTAINGKEAKKRGHTSLANIGLRTQKKLEEFLINKLKDKTELITSIGEMSKVIEKSNSYTYEIVARITNDTNADIILVNYVRHEGIYTWKIKTSSEDKCIKTKKRKKYYNNKIGQQQSVEIAKAISSTEVKIEDENAVQITWDL